LVSCSPPPSKTFVFGAPYSSSVMMGTGVGLLLYHQTRTSASTVNGPAPAERGVAVARRDRAFERQRRDCDVTRGAIISAKEH
jgi:hypothetical protein